MTVKCRKCHSPTVRVAQHQTAVIKCQKCSTTMIVRKDGSVEVEQ